MTDRVRAQPRSGGGAGRRAGFALILTLVLLSFLVLLLVGLATFTKVETSISDNAAKQAQARQNALMALNIALGQLQKYAGPDTRVTATAEAFGGVTGTKYYTGVWDSTTTGATPLTWLVSGNENTNTAVTPTSPTSDFAELVGTGSSDTANAVMAKAVPVTADVTGIGSGTTIGRYAWWVGDEGVEASVALPDRLSEVTYAPWDDDMQRQRLRLQIASTPNYFRDLSGGSQYGFDPQAVSTLLSRIEEPTQLALLPSYDSSAYPAFLKTHFFDFTPVAMSVLANTLTGTNRGLMKDLSLAPSELGAAFAAYANYSSHMETVGGSVESLRRRYAITAPVTSSVGNGIPALTFSVAPVVTSLYLQFGLSRSTPTTSSAQVYAKTRVYVALWNPYTSALVPPTSDGDLTMEITGLPSVTPVNALGATGSVVDLQAAAPAAIRGASGAMVFNLTFDNSVSSGTDYDKSSWLPGRLYFWVTPTGTEPSNTLTFYNQLLNAAGYLYDPVDLANTGSSTNTQLGIQAPAVANLTVVLKYQGTQLASYQLPAYLEVNEAPTSSYSWKFAYTFRLAEPSSLDGSRTWLETYDPRAVSPPNEAYIAFDPSKSLEDPSVYTASSSALTSGGNLNQYLIYRITSTSASEASVSPNNDVPLFELPRSPILSLGELQHLQVTGQRPFSIGNSWGGTANGLFDRFFFSGLPLTGGGPDLSARQPLPNWNLIPVDSRSDPASALDLSVLRDGNNPLSSRYLLQAGGFNVNSLSIAGWRAVLSGLRFVANEPFKYVTAELTDQTLGFDQDATLGTGIYQPVFTRFPQSAQETYYWESGSSNHAQLLSTQAFRMGIRGVNAAVSDPLRATADQFHYLTTDQVEALATSLVTAIKDHQAASGPYRTMEEFLSADAVLGGKSAIEKALEDAAINPTELTFADASLDSSGAFSAPGFGSLTVTQADILNALAPYLKPRSDTFVIRAYGEQVNPATGAAEGRAWVEARVQRLPTVVDASDDIAQPRTDGLGRRFRILSLKWLNSSDL